MENFNRAKHSIRLVLIVIVILVPRSIHKAHATTALGMVYKNNLYLAADSKVYGNVTPICKIFEVKRLYYTVAGILDNADYNFSIPRTVKLSYYFHPGIQSAFNDFRLRIQPKFVSYLNSWGSDHPQQLQKYGSMHALRISVTFAGFESGNIATLCVVQVGAIPPYAIGKIRVKVFSSECKSQKQLNPDQFHLRESGESEGDRPCIERTGEPGYTPPDLEKCIIDREIKLHPKSVGPPISILFISPIGSKWLSRGVCPNEPAEGPPPFDSAK